MAGSRDIPAVVRDQLVSVQNPTSAEFMLVKYVFDFSMARHDLAGETYYEVGRNDLAMPLVLSESTGHLFLVDDCSPAFINSSLPQFLDAVRAFREAARAWDDNTPDDRRLREFDEFLLTIDPESLQGPDAFWSQVREEMKYGMV